MVPIGSSNDFSLRFFFQSRRHTEPKSTELVEVGTDFQTGLKTTLLGLYIPTKITDYPLGPPDRLTGDSPIRLGSQKWHVKQFL